MKKEETLRKCVNTKTLAKVGVLAAVSTVIMLLEFPLPFAPSFYKLDFSEIPVLVGAFALGPMAGIAIEFIKILLNFVLNGTVTAGVGEIANFLIGCALVVPASIIYRQSKSFKSAIIGLVAGIFTLTIIGAILNYFVLLPVYSTAYGAPLQAFVDMGNVLNKHIVDLKTLVLYAVVPFNLVKGILVSIITIIIYKKLSPILHR